MNSPKRGSEEGSPNCNQPRILLGNEDGFVEQDQDMEDGEGNHDPTCSEGTLKCRISCLSELSEKLLSPPIFVRDLPW